MGMSCEVHGAGWGNKDLSFRWAAGCDETHRPTVAVVAVLGSFAPTVGRGAKDPEQGASRYNPHRGDVP